MRALLLLPAIFWRHTRNMIRAWRHPRVDWVRLEVKGAMPEVSPRLKWWQRRLLGAQPQHSLMALRRQMQRVAADPRTRGIILRIRNLNAGWATVQSIRDEILRLRKAGKRVLAYVMGADEETYYLACAADEIVMPPSAMMLVMGLRAEVNYLKDALDKVGLAAEVVAVSPYKSAGEPFVRSNMSEENRAQLERVMNVRYQQLRQGMAEGRKKSVDDVEALLRRMPMLASDAAKVGLVDATLYEDELEEHLKEGERKPTILEWNEAHSRLVLPPLRVHKKLVAVVPVVGTIMQGPTSGKRVPLPLGTGDQVGSDSVAQSLRQLERMDHVAAVVIHVDSRGGDAFASDLIWREVLRLRAHKPVVVSMGNAAASGGYYLAAPASEIVAQPGTLTGSIGVIVVRPMARGLLDKLGVNTEVLTRGSRTGTFSATVPPNDDERAALRDLVMASYAQFRGRVMEGRKMAEEKLEPISGGRVYTGEEALGLGLVDRLGDLTEAVARARNLAGLPDDPTAPLLVIHNVGHTLLPPKPFPRTLKELLAPGVWALMPWDLR
ncbi:MAG: signal peptide peptidase SppA [Myxococcota bacterium]